LIIAASLYLSFLLRFDFVLDNQKRQLILEALPFFIIVKLLAFGFFKLYRVTWRYVGLTDLYNIVSSVIVSQSILMVLILVPKQYPLSFLPSFSGFPRSIFLIDGVMTLLLISGLRISKRMYLELIMRKNRMGNELRTLIIGAGNTADMIIRDMSRFDSSRFNPAGFIDDDMNKIGRYIHGVKVLGKIDALKEVISKYSIEAVIIAIPSLNYKLLRIIYNTARECGVKTIKIIPRIYDFHKPYLNLKNLEDIKIEDLIGRQTVEIEYEEIEEFLEGKRILITGAGGSIGSEITKQVCGFNPETVILYDIDETALHEMEIDTKRLFPYLTGKLHFIVGNILDDERIEGIFKEFRPNILFHAAAYKHVPMMEYNPEEAVKVNIFGTHKLANAAVKHGVERFILISTDKAIKPSSIMGATKRMAEHVCKTFNGDRNQKSEVRSQTEFISVRFGNVLGSRGSVLPLFMEQLKYGGPLTVTHKDMRRYFMTIPEAVSLVLQASVIGKGGDVLVLDMGEPVKIVSLAEELIKIHGLEPYKDINIEFIGLRPGEKLFEEILTADEGTIASKHKKIFIATGGEKYSKEKIENIVTEFETAIRQPSTDGDRRVRDLLKKYVVWGGMPDQDCTPKTGQILSKLKGQSNVLH
ncbi:MAG: nucleoside-diphosphate sugar epimerase/dehydratase, partial [Candidatus Aenigmatarchaeota archaeon]